MIATLLAATLWGVLFSIKGSNTGSRVMGLVTLAAVVWGLLEYFA